MKQRAGGELGNGHGSSLVREKDERGKALFANVERGVGIFLQNFHTSLPIGQI